MFWIIAVGLMLVVTLVGFIAEVVAVDKNDEKRSENIVGAVVLMLIIGGVFSAVLYEYTLPHHGNNPEIEDFPKEACMDTIYTHHDGKIYTTYKLRWKDDKVWED